MKRNAYNEIDSGNSYGLIRSWNTVDELLRSRIEPTQLRNAQFMSNALTAVPNCRLNYSDFRFRIVRKRMGCLLNTISFDLPTLVASLAKKTL